ncbi:hypothetical protein scyTo_0022699, partial [Scyliorhinus torazame]|nr:hypothetical protein [Scyliorhinus torazame]
MRTYEDKLYEHWQSETNIKLHLLLKQSLLKKISVSATSLGSSAIAESSFSAHEDWYDANSTYDVNFAPELQEIIMESKYMEQLGFQIPQLARNVALQEQKFIRYTTGLNNMLHRYGKLMNSLSSAETKLMTEHIRELHR